MKLLQEEVVRALNEFEKIQQVLGEETSDEYQEVEVEGLLQETCNFECILYTKYKGSFCPKTKAQKFIFVHNLTLPVQFLRECFHST